MKKSEFFPTKFKYPSVANLSVGNISQLRVNDIHFTQHSVSNEFTDGSLLTDLVDQLLDGVIAPHEVELIRVVKHQNKWFTLDNRRLRVFKDAFVEEIPVIVCDLNDAKIKKEFLLKKTNKSNSGGGIVKTPKTDIFNTHFDDGNFIFVKRVLNWTFAQLEQPLPVLAKIEPLDICFNSREEYFESFLELILEEARATLQAGLTLPKEKAVTFQLTFSSVKFANNFANPCVMQLFKISGDEYIKSGDVLRLQCNAYPQLPLLALAIYTGANETESNKISLKVVMDEDTRMQLQDNGAFEDDVLWQAKMLGSLITHLRMYEVCASMPATSFEQNLLSGELDYPEEITFEFKSPKLNPFQRQAIEVFLSSDQGIQLIQGPPGTGKTTTIITLLNILYQQKLRVLVCAPSNKAVHVLAERFLAKYPELPSILVGVEDKLPIDHPLRDIFVHTWGSQTKDRIIDTINLLWNVSPDSLFTNQEIQEDLDKNIKSFEHWLSYFERYKLKFSLDPVYQSLEVIKVFLLLLGEEGYEKSPANIKYVRKILGNATDSLNNLLQRLEISLIDDSIQGLEGQLLNNASIIFSTLSVAGRKLLKEMKSVDILIVDEASQALEAEILIPFITNPKRCLLIGDTKQLPATVISQEAEKRNFGRSLMSRLIEDCDQLYSLLKFQYRMHPEIRKWPSIQYYDNELKDTKKIVERDPLLKDAHPIFEPYAFINIDAVEQMHRHSFANAQEAFYISRILYYLQTKNIDVAKQVGIITFYAAQVEQIKSQLRKANLPIDNVYTVDSFQGDERDFIIISFVRANPRGTIGFLNDFRRLNVALTRAKFSLIMLGNAATFEKKESDVSKLIINARDRKLFFEESTLLQILKPPQKPKSSFNKSKQITQPSGFSRRNFSQSASSSYEMTKPPIYKTELCRFFNGQPKSCEWADKCKFAHGEEELQPKPP